MSTLRYFGAPWGAPLRIVTCLCCAVLAGVCIAGLAGSTLPIPDRLLMVLAPPVAIAVGALFAIRGYELAADAILVLRPGWQTCIPLEGLRTVTSDPAALRRSIRACGNGGFFSFTGWYSNKTLGRYRLFGTDLKRAVVLVFPNRRVVLTPEDPEAFVRCVRELARLGEAPRLEAS